MNGEQKFWLIMWISLAVIAGTTLSICFFVHTSHQYKMAELGYVEKTIDINGYLRTHWVKIPTEVEKK